MRRACPSTPSCRTTPRTPTDTFPHTSTPERLIWIAVAGIVCVPLAAGCGGGPSTTALDPAVTARTALLDAERAAGFRPLMAALAACNERPGTQNCGDVQPTANALRVALGKVAAAAAAAAADPSPPCVGHARAEKAWADRARGRLDDVVTLAEHGDLSTAFRTVTAMINAGASSTAAACGY
jgi:hypothetical protein